MYKTKLFYKNLSLASKRITLFWSTSQTKFNFDLRTNVEARSRNYSYHGGKFPKASFKCFPNKWLQRLKWLYRKLVLLFHYG